MKRLVLLLVFIISFTIVFIFTLKMQNATDRFDICVYSYIAGVLSMAIAVLIID